MFRVFLDLRLNYGTSKFLQIGFKSFYWPLLLFLRTFQTLEILLYFVLWSLFLWCLLNCKFIRILFHVNRVWLSPMYVASLFHSPMKISTLHYPVGITELWYLVAYVVIWPRYYVSTACLRSEKTLNIILLSILVGNSLFMYCDN